MENGALSLLEQKLHFLYYFQKYSKLILNFSCQCCLMIENDDMIKKIAYGVKGLALLLETEMLLDYLRALDIDA